MMPVSEIILDVAITAMAGVGVWVLPRVWRGAGVEAAERGAAVWLRRESSRRAFVRGGAAVILGWPWLALALWALDAHKYGRGTLSSVGLLVEIGSLAVFVVFGIGLNATV